MWPALVLLLVACGPKPSTPTPEVPTGPVAPDATQKEHVHTEHGVERPDPYYWLRERENPEVIAYVEAENQYAEARTAHLESFRSMLTDELLGRIQQTRTDPPVRHGQWSYYTRREEGKDYEIHCRKPAAGGEEQIILDENVLAEGKEFFSLAGYQVSPDHTLLAYSTDLTGREEYTLRIRDLTTGEDLPDTIENVAGSVAWASDNRHFFYDTRDETLRPAFIWRHALGEAQDVQVWHEEDPEFGTGTRRTRSGGYIVISSYSATAQEYRVLKADDPTGEFEVFTPRHHGHEHSIDHQGNRWLIRTNDCDDEQGKHTSCALNFKVMTAAEDARSRTDWQEMIPHRDDVTIESVRAFKDFAVIHERDGGVVQIRILDGGEELHRISQPAESFTARGSSNPEYDSGTYRFWYTSLVSPWQAVDYDVGTRERTVIYEQPVLGDFDAADYVTTRVECEAPDGTGVPMSIVHRADLPAGPAPALLYAYGSYGFAMDPSFDSARLSYLDRGMVYAIAHIRGGGDMGRGWYEDGKFLHKKNTFTDFIACAEELVSSGRTTPEQLVIQGGSAGGLLMGAVVNMRPDLFAAAHAAVPFVDVVTTMLDESIPLTTGEWEEWGDPREKTYFDYMLSYSPYDNVEAKDYPAMLVTSGLHDPRVQYWEPTKWVARLRDRKTDNNVLMLRTNMDAGHGGASGLRGRMAQRAWEMSFFFDQLGLTEAELR